MNFDLSSFLTAMLKAFLDCQDDGASETPRQMLDNQGLAVRFAARRELRRQAKRQGINRRERRDFVNDNIDFAIEELSRQIDSVTG